MSTAYNRQNQDYLARQWGPYLAAAGIPTNGKTAQQIFAIAGRIIHDSFLFGRTVEKHLELEAANPSKFPALLPSGLSLQMLKEMSKEEKAALRLRIGA